ncbi:MAG: thioredoxin family protein [Acidobacteria bacterium]|nr:thioredoxin family protein [Acidobacteriota bacterium]
MAHKMAFVNEHITADAIAALDFMDLSRKYRVTGVPKTIVNETIDIVGALPESMFVRAALQIPEESPSTA